MKKLRRVKLNKIKAFFKKLPRAFGERAFLTFLGLFLLAVILGFFVFFHQNLLNKKGGEEISEKPAQFKEKNYQNLLEIWQEREEKFEAADEKQYLNPFEVD